MLVKAKKAGFYGTRRRKGAIFDASDEKFSEAWMEKVETPAPFKPAVKAKSKRKAKAKPKPTET